MKHLIALLVLSALLGSCKKNTHNSDCDDPDLTSGICLTDSASVSTSIIGKWKWIQRTTATGKGNPCTVSHHDSHYYEFFPSGIFYDQLGNDCPLIYRYYLNSNVSLTTYDSINNNTFHEGQASICNGYLILDNSAVDGPKDVFVRQ